jgi:hypothetical protein
MRIEVLSRSVVEHDSSLLEEGEVSILVLSLLLWDLMNIGITCKLRTIGLVFQLLYPSSSR